MNATATCPSPGVYQYTYPTFVDVPQLICIHFLSPDCQHAFVSYPQRRHKAARLVPVDWFKSVALVALGGQPQLLAFVEFLVSGLVKGNRRRGSLKRVGLDEPETYLFQEPLAA